MRKWTRIAHVSALVLAGVTSMVSASAAAWKQEKFLIGGWFGLPFYPANYTPLLHYQDAGFDFINGFDYHFDEPRSARLVATLDSLRRARPGFTLQAMIHYTAPVSTVSPGANIALVPRERAVEKLLVRNNPYSGPSVLGWFIDDEPVNQAQMRKIGAAMRTIRSQPWTASGLAYVNLFPASVAGASDAYTRAYGKDRRPAYERYLDDYFSQCNADSIPAPVVSYDSYPFHDDGFERTDFFLTLRMARDKAKQYSRRNYAIPVWSIIQLSPYKPAGKPYNKQPTMPQVRWQAWVAVAYGAKSISYWTSGWGTNPGADIGYGAGILDRELRTTDRFEPVKRLNAELHALGPTLLQLEPVASVHVSVGQQKDVEDELLASPARAATVVADIEPSGGREDCMVGVFRHRGTGDDYLLVVNKSLSESRTFRLQLSRPVPAIDRVRRTDGRTERVSSNARSLEVRSLPAVSAELYRLSR